jgi:hypothetical protein
MMGLPKNGYPKIHDLPVSALRLSLDPKDSREAPPLRPVPITVLGQAQGEAEDGPSQGKGI